MKYWYQTAAVSALATTLVLSTLREIKLTAVAEASSQNLSLQMLLDTTENKRGKSGSIISKQLVSEVCDLEPLPIKAECYRLSVSENRSKPSSRMIGLAVVVLKSKSSHPKSDPVVFVPGGPGESARASINSLVNSPILAQRDLILMDPRGTDRSQPNEPCPDGVSPLNLILTTRQPFNQSLALVQTAQRQCALTLRANGVDLNGYNTIEVATDLADLRKALRIKKWNLYGTRPALEIVRSHPEGVRSVVLDSVAPPNFATKPTRLVSSAQRGLDYLFAACQADSACNTRFPNLGARFTKMVNRYNRQPLRIQLPMNTDGTLNLNIEANGNSLLFLIWSSLYAEQIIPNLPLLIDQLAAGKTELFNSISLPLIQQRLIGNSSEGNSSQTFGGNVFLTECIDGGRSIDNEDRALLNNPGIYSSFLLSIGIYCDGLAVNSAPKSFNQPVQSNIPTLLIAGSFDPITPPKVTRQAGKTLSRATYVEIPNSGHIPSTTSSCAQSIMSAFITNPLKTLDTSCVKSLKTEFRISQ